MIDSLADFSNDLRNDLMVRLYKDWFTYKPRLQSGYFGPIELPGRLDVNIWLAEKGISRHDAYLLIKLYEEEDLVEFIQPHYAQLTGLGVKFCEDNGLVEDVLVKRSKEVAIVMLQVAALIAADQRRATLRGGMLIYPVDGVEQLISEKNISKYEEDAAVRMLCKMGLIDHCHSYRGMQITEKGQKLLSEHRAQEKLRLKFETLQTGGNFTPQKRGHELEALLEFVLKDEGWNVERNVRTIGQEHDLIINRQLDYYIISCKWESKCTQQRQIGELRDRVTARPGMGGIFVSMGRFTQSAIIETASRLEAGLILLYGPLDIENVMRNKVKFSDLLRSKYHEVLVGRNMLVDGKIVSIDAKNQ